MKDVDLFARAVGDHLDWARKVIGSDIRGTDQVRLMDQLESVAARTADPSLYVAVFGEFASGKSTLLNALLGESLLPSSSMVTTSVPTVLRPADRRWLRVRLEASGEWLTLGEPPFHIWYRRVVGEDVPTMMSGALKAILTTERAALDLKEIEVGIPAAILGSRVVLIDTPGFNATEARHLQLAREAARRTDIAVVVVPATAPVSMSLGDFLTDALADQLGRCVFVLSKGRLFEPEEQQDLARWTVKRLEDLGIATPLVLEAPSGDEALKALESGHRDDPAVALLTGLARSLATFAGEHHQAAVEASIRLLLHNLMESMDRSASTEREQLVHAERELASMRVTDLDAFLETWARGTKRSVRRAVADVPDPLPFNQVTVKGAIAPRVAAATQPQQLQMLAGELPGIVDQHFTAGAKRLLRAQAKKARKELATALDDLGADFSSEYGRLAVLSGRSPAPVELRRTRVTLSSTAVDLTTAFEAASATSAKLVSDDNWVTGAGVGLGVVIGTILMPGIGTVVGGILGAFFGGLNAAKRAAFQAEVDRALDQAERSLTRAVHKDLDAISERACAEVDRVVGIYYEAFSADVKELVKEEACRRRAMAHRIHAATAVIEESRRRRGQLEGSRR